MPFLVDVVFLFLQIVSMETLLIVLCTTLIIQSTISEKYRSPAADRSAYRKNLDNEHSESNIKVRTQMSDKGLNTANTSRSRNSPRQSISKFDRALISQKLKNYRNINLRESSENTDSSLIKKQFINRFDDKNLFFKSSVDVNNYWARALNENLDARKDNVKKLDSSFTWPTWSSKNEIYHNNRPKKNRKHLDNFDDYLGLDSKYHEMADRKYIHEHEGFFFPIHIPSHHEKDDHLIPLLLLLLLPLLLFAIIIPLNANLLSTLFLIMQNNGATTTAAQLAAATGKKRRDLRHPLVEERIMEALHKISKIPDF